MSVVIRSESFIATILNKLTSNEKNDRNEEATHVSSILNQRSIKPTIAQNTTKATPQGWGSLTDLRRWSRGEEAHHADQKIGDGTQPFHLFLLNGTGNEGKK
jgi:hypothetical protein